MRGSAARVKPGVGSTQGKPMLQPPKVGVRVRITGILDDPSCRSPGEAGRIPKVNGSSTSGEDALKRDDPVQHERGLTVFMRHRLRCPRSFPRSFARLRYPRRFCLMPVGHEFGHRTRRNHKNNRDTVQQAGRLDVADVQL